MLGGYPAGIYLGQYAPSGSGEEGVLTPNPAQASWSVVAPTIVGGVFDQTLLPSPVVATWVFIDDSGFRAPNPYIESHLRRLKRWGHS
jgi:hypothetical protein